MPQLLHPTKSIPADLAHQALARAEQSLPWLREMPPVRRAVVERVTQAGILSFQRFFRDPDSVDGASMFDVAPRELVRSVTLQQTLQLMRITSAVVEESLSTPEEREASVVFSRQLAFAAAELYASVGDGSGLWDRRLEQFVVDASVNGPISDMLHQRIVAVGWRGHGAAIAARGSRPVDRDHDRIRRLAWDAGADVLVGDSGDDTIVIAAVTDGHEPEELRAVIAAVADAFGPGPVVVGPPVRDVTRAWRSLQAAAAAQEVLPSVDLGRRIVVSSELLPERALAGDPLARRDLIHSAFLPLRASRQPLLDTARQYLDAGGAVESAARALDVHPNTVRYRLKRIADATGFDPTVARDAFVLQCAIRLGLMAEAASARSAAQ